ncbi:hypothetical protein ACFQ51_47380 [Streptomyces kaempferi]
MTPPDVLATVPLAKAPPGGRRSGRSATLVVGCVLAGLIALLALVSLFWLPYSADDTSGGRLAGPGGGHLLGTDKLGRDLFTQVMTGSRIAVEAASDRYSSPRPSASPWGCSRRSRRAGSTTRSPRSSTS